MKWISNLNRQSVLPILFGISLTTFGLSVAILLYTMFEQDDDNDKKKHSQIATSKCKKMAVQIKIPEKYVSAIIGKGGAVIKNIEELTNTHIKMEKENSFSKERICYIHAYNIKDIHSAQSLIQGVINNLPEIESFELFVPYEASRMVFKRNWSEFAQEIQKSYGAKIIIESDAHKTETGLKRRIILKGTADQIARAIIQIEDKVQEEVKAQALLKGQVAAARGRSKLSPSNTNVRNTMYDCPDIEIYEVLVPYKVCGRIIGKGGTTVREIERSSGAKISIENTANEIESIERKVMVKGTAEQINLAIIQIKEKVREANESRTELDREFTMTIKKITESELSSCNNDTSTSNNILKLSSPTLEQQNDFIEVYVSAMETPSLFWIQVVGPANIDLQHLVSDMTTYYNIEENRALHMLKKITAGQIVAAKFKYDSQWYRAEIISVESSQCEVFFVDYGDVEIVPIDDILELRTDMLSLRVQAVECSLANVKPRESEWSPEANDKFAELAYLAKWKVLVAKVRGYKERSVDYAGSRRKSSMIPCIDLYERVGDKHVNIGDGLIQLGMAQIEEEICSAVNSALSRDKCDLQFIPFLSDTFNLKCD